MYGSEIPVFFLCLAFALATWVSWVVRISTPTMLGCPRFARTPLMLAPAGCAVALYFILRRYASHDVVDSPQYLLFYIMMGAAWVGALRWLFVPLGLSWRDDIVERANGAAMTATIGALFGLTFAFAGGNIGDGPGWWVVVFASGMATAAWFAGWLALELVARPSEGVTVDRDGDCGLRLGAYLLASGAIAGRGAAGDWVSAGATLRDFMPYAAGMAALTALALGVETMLRGPAGAKFRNLFLCGIVPAAVYVGGAVAYITRKGWW